MAFKGTSHFIGRHEEREQIKELLVSGDIQVLQIYGLPSSGKTELIRQVCREINSELQVQILYRRITDGQLLNTEICQFLKDIKNSKILSIIVLYPLLGYGFLKSTDENKNQFQVPTLFQDYANQQLAHLRHEDTTKLKFSTIIGKTLTEAEHLWENGLIYEALGVMTNNWANVHKLLQQAIHTPSDGNSFQIYYKVVIDANNIISLCYPNEAKLFCKAISDSAQIFGSKDQQALSMASYGHTLVESSEKEALQLYKMAEENLAKSHHKYQYIILLYNMSKAYYRCGKLQKGIRCAEEALSIQVTDRDAAEVQHVKTYAASNLAYNLIFATEYEQAKKVLLQTLREVGESGHPSVTTLLNLLGLNEERSKGDLNKALTFYFASLSKKRILAKFQEHLLVTTLCNVAGQLSKTKRKHDFALRFLYEAEEIRKRAGWVHSYSALVVWNIGMVFMRKQMQAEALVKLKEAEKLYAAVNPSHYVNAEVKVWLAHCHLLLNNAQEAKQISLEVIRDREIYHKYRPQGEFALNSLEHLIRLSILDPKEQQIYIEEILKELPRLYQCPGTLALLAKKS
ncbi:unnamed protein product [Acanthosepion pharaonis]|uniref:Uncharacterized protein n=1 Tax=Acanthosepion pharaonis TaxID=158019 RepID=A0A812DWR7_ACAPH|nr:unnamed protein product [Sepia pharaonis]